MAQQAGMLQIVDGKSRAAKRVLPMMPAVRASLEARWTAQGEPKVGGVFASGSKSGTYKGTARRISTHGLWQTSQTPKNKARVQLWTPLFPARSGTRH
jgi:hypothetical protein